jgi:hypothetical protein
MIDNIDAMHPQYQKTIAAVKLVRDSTDGEVSIKSLENQKIYLPDDCDNNSPDKSAMYNMRVKKAEYDAVPSNTLGSLLGAINRQPHDFSGIPTSLSYMLDDIDGDGMTAQEMTSLMVSELLQMRYCGVLAEYSDLASAGFESNKLTREQAKRANLRASVKFYSRESIINWDFKTINGAKQLNFVVLKETESVPVSGTLLTEMINSYLLLALDEDGKYYQMRYVEEINGMGGWSEKVYPSKTNGAFDYIPFNFCIMGEYQKGKLPIDCGYLFPICTKTLHRYQTSADYKMAMWYSASPITYSTNWDSHAVGVYKELTGNDYIKSGPGAHVPLADGATMGLLDWSSESSAFEVYFERNAREIEALGGVFDCNIESDEKTATAKAINAAEKKGALTSIVVSVEQCLSKVIEQCGEFTGIAQPVDIKLNREFSVNAITPQERSAILAEWQTGLINESEALAQLERGGILTQSASDILTQIQTIGD